MRRLVQRLAYRDAVLGHLGALLLVYPPKRQFGADFPELRSLILAHFNAGTAAPRAAIEIACFMLETLLGQLGASEKADARQAVAARPEADVEALAKRRLSGEKTPVGTPARFATDLAGVALFMARRMAAEGALRWEDCERLAASIETALGGAAPK